MLFLYSETNFFPLVECSGHEKDASIETNITGGKMPCTKLKLSNTSIDGSICSPYNYPFSFRVNVYFGCTKTTEKNNFAKNLGTTNLSILTCNKIQSH